MTASLGSDQGDLEDSLGAYRTLFKCITVIINVQQNVKKLHADKMAPS